MNFSLYSKIKKLITFKYYNTSRITVTIASSKDPKTIDPMLLKDLHILLKIGELGFPYSKYQIATVELIQYAPKP